ncbi:nucleoside monophosphate kinase, partial [Candidatus Micrarchaeota archaeon]|nr:nucleoside monophosphate kinase [Candidatus Micrarchaeota archaeon]
QAKLLSKKLVISHVSAGDLIRVEAAKKTELGRKINSIISKGELLSDELTTRILEKRLRKRDARKGAILDGYPRTLRQAELLEKLLARLKLPPASAAVNLKISRVESIKRLSARRQCGKCGAIYSLLFDKISESSQCPKCGGSLFKRSDDEPAVIQERLEVYENQTKPLLAYYSRKKILREVNGEKPVEQVFKQVLQALGALKK